MHIPAQNQSDKTHRRPHLKSVAKRKKREEERGVGEGGRKGPERHGGWAFPLLRRGSAVRRSGRAADRAW